MAKIVITDVKGLNQIKSGNGVQIDSALTKYPKLEVNAVTDNATLEVAGVYTVSGTAAKELILPLASSAPGAMLVVRSLSAHAHYLTGSAESMGTQVFAGQPGTGAALAGKGSKLTLPAVVGSSVALISDGVNFLVSAASGSFTLAGT